MKEETTKLTCINNYCKNNHIINEYQSEENFYKDVLKGLFFENKSLESKKYFKYENWF